MLACLKSGSGHCDWGELSCAGLFGFLFIFWFQEGKCLELHSHWFFFTPQKVTGLEPMYSAVEWFCCCFNLYVKSGNVNLTAESESKIEICVLVATGLYSRVCLWIAELVTFSFPSNYPLVLGWQSISCLSCQVRAVLKLFLLSSLHISESLRNEARRRFLRQRAMYL